MPDPTLEALFAFYDDTIAELPDAFDSHAFIAALAQRHQREYIEALYALRDGQRPFQTLHASLAKHLLLQEGIERVEPNHDSRNVFGNMTDCAQWRKTTHRE